jgi:hypothetical protein
MRIPNALEGLKLLANDLARLAAWYAESNHGNTHVRRSKDFNGLAHLENKAPVQRR